MSSNLVSTDELIRSISDLLLLSDGETIAKVANDVGLNVSYDGDSMFEVEEN